LRLDRCGRINRSRGAESGPQKDDETTMTTTTRKNAARLAQTIADTRESLARNIREGNKLAAQGDRDALARLGVTVC